MTRIRFWPVAILAVAVAILGGGATSAQDKYTLQVPNGLAFSDFRGYEDWQVVSVAETDEVLKVIVANPTMIDAYRPAFPATASLSPTAPRSRRSSGPEAQAPFSVNVPDNLKNVFFIEKDSKRFPDSAGWGYALFNYTVASDSFAPDGSGNNCGFACHTIVKAKDYIFHPYQKR